MSPVSSLRPWARGPEPSTPSEAFVPVHTFTEGEGTWGKQGATLAAAESGSWGHRHFRYYSCHFSVNLKSHVLSTHKAFLLHAALRSRSGAGPARWPPASGPPDQLSRPGALRVPRTPVRGSSRASLTLPGANTRTPDPGQALAAPHQAAAPPPSPLGRPKPAGPVQRGPTPPRPPTGRRAAPSLARLTQLPRAAR